MLVAFIQTQEVRTWPFRFGFNTNQICKCIQSSLSMTCVSWNASSSTMDNTRPSKPNLWYTKQSKKSFKEMIDLVKLLIKQLVQAIIPELYLKPFHNRYSNEISTQITKIFTNLFAIYCTVSLEEFQAKLIVIMSKSFDITQLIVFF